MAELKPCPKCGRRPLIGYACGEWFIVAQVGGCGVCDTFGEMHASREQEVEAWNRRAEHGKYCPIMVAGGNMYVSQCIGKDCTWWLPYANDCAGAGWL